MHNYFSQGIRNKDTETSNTFASIFMAAKSSKTAIYSYFLVRLAAKKMFGVPSATFYSTVIFIILEMMQSMTALIPLPELNRAKSQQKEQNSPDTCSFLKESSHEECVSFWAGKKPPVILISLDGFRTEYLSRRALENGEYRGEWAAATIRCMAQRGTTAPYIMPSYPTITFPNHYSIVTGLYPESHGIIGNQFYDPDLKANFSIYTGATDSKWWQNGEPIWTTARKQGKISATYFWPGSDVTFPEEEQRSPNYFFKYDKTRSFRERVNQVLRWMDLPIDKRPAITTLYFEDPDSIAHETGPNTVNVTEKVTIVDRQIRRLMDGLIERNISNCVNLIIVSDHGMAESPPGQKLVNLVKYASDLQHSALTFLGPVTSIRPLNDTQKEEERIGVALSCKDPNMRVFSKWELPYRMHSARTRRIPSLMLDMDINWRSVLKKEAWAAKGTHGWDNLYLDMQAIFVAHGPSFKNRKVVRPFENVQLYNLMCQLVNMTPSANNGTWGALHHLLVDPPSLKVIPDMHQQFLFHRTFDDIKEGALRNRTGCALVNGKEKRKTTLQIEIEMKVSKDREKELFNVHAPLGIPMIFSTVPNVSNQVLLINEDYLTAFNTELGIPLWTTYTVSGHMTTKTNDGKWIEDSRLETNHTGTCKRLSSTVQSKEIVYTHLFPKEFATQKEDAWLDTNLLEVRSGISRFIKKMTRMISGASVPNGKLHVISGPTRHLSGYIFFVITACKTVGEWNLTTCPVEQRDLQAFLLPAHQWKYQNSCISDKDFISYNVATLKDVERVTRFQFFSDLPMEEKLILLARTTLDSKLIIDPTRRNTFKTG